ncbi:LapA family protein [Denitromonas iodatirespirans]|uniref:LapA family protein n=1 Tax=Denitromonas iodatirespirans TaxID=2795389 RepID=A0A944H855_DENI1|nr:LapA family protein [Denitromonas iodatirespirans]MBT0961943.1 LapA family protein [Denitromonas iodatirespirans]
MRIIVWIIRLAVFLVLFGFAVKNDQFITLNFYMGKQWQLPLVFVILVAFAAGALVGVTATLSSLVRQRREIGRLRKALRKAEAEVKSTVGTAVVPRPDGDAPEAF